MSEDLCYMPAADLVAAYRAGKLSPVDVTQALLQRIATINPKVNAYNLVDEASALRDAKASEARWKAGKPFGPIDGVPASIKDIILTKGWPTLRGSKTVDPNQDWNEDAPVTARLREAGCVILGKTTSPEFGWKGVTDSPLTGITRNPWNTDLTPGGSSGGASAQVAAGLGQLAVGTDGGGSIRIPAGFTGIAGLKPSFGRVPAAPLSPFGTVAHLGPMTRTVRDAALMLREMAKPDARDWFSLPYQDVDYTANLNDGVKGLKIAYSPTLGFAKVDPEILAAVDVAAKQFAALGATVEQVDPGFSDPLEVFHAHWFMGAFNALMALPKEKFALIDPGLQRTFERGAAITTRQYMEAVNARGKLGVQMRQFHETYDLLLTPSLAVLPFTAGRVAPESMGDAYWTEWTPFTYPFNLTQQPGLSIPCGFSKSGLPISLQLVGPMHGDALVLRAGAAYEAATEWHKARPNL
ncbi:amidase [Ferrovibrio terrae]|uniref:Amidase n=1 Tax=Ferrovibrio terrae TaxID=2594003 RepID=A0A516H3L1_9PROT|nr:amidase [Ferrovibrio terrae]QDO98363.1 amidase [Ferrovibrio terrae]